MEQKQQQLIDYLNSLMHGPKQTILVSELMIKFDMPYVDVVLTVQAWLMRLSKPVLSA